MTTGRRRRKASGIPWEHLEMSVMLNSPTQIALTFCDHLDGKVKSTRKIGDPTSPVRKLIAEVEKRTQVPAALMETGKMFGDIIQMNA
ncbi:MAG: hypothetical protein CME25_00295 [Gemmatimonadetes bacterium]|nr:hypothetical protein [Gemmatimonadota bacterium]